MKVKLILVLFGIGLGCLVFLIAYPLVKNLALDSAVPEGAKFNSVDGLRSALSKPESEADQKKITLRDLLVPNPSDLIMYELAPNLDLTFQRAHVRTNSDGMRDFERSFEKEQDHYRIALLGDSFAFGWGVEMHESFAQVLEELLNESSKEITYEVLNFGVPGYSTFQQVEQFMEKGIKFQPDAVLIFAVENDFGLPFFITNFDAGEGLIPANKFEALDDKEKKDLIKKAINPNYALKKLEAFCKEKEIEIFFAINPNKKAQDMRRSMWYLRESDYIKYLPLRKRFLKIFHAMDLPDESLSLSFDPHPSPLKHKILGQVLAEKIIAELNTHHLLSNQN